MFVLAVQSTPSPAVGSVTTRIEPTCTEPGQFITEDMETHAIRAETIPPTGHSFGDWTPLGEGHEERRCSVCGAVETRVIMTEEEKAFPRLELNGSLDGINKKARVTLTASYSGPEGEVSCYAVMTMQGHSTLGLDKANYTLRFFDDSDGTNKHKLCFRDWSGEHKFILKADYYDTTQCRNLVGAKLWRELVESRENVPERIASLPTLGAVDGFPVSVWYDGDFLGLYTLCLHKDDDLFGMKNGERAAILVCNKNTEDEALFRAPAILDNESMHDWELEYCGTEDRDWARESFNSLINFVMHSSNADFKNELGSYLDVDAAIDYLLFLYTLGLENGGAKDLVLVSYGDVWIPCAYDMDEAFGLMPLGEGEYAPDSFLPRLETGVWSSGTGSLLWDRLLQNYSDELRARYAELRAGTLSEAHILAAVDEYIEQIPASLYLREAERYTGRPEAAAMKNQIHDYLTGHLPLLDEILLGGN